VAAQLPVETPASGDPDAGGRPDPGHPRFQPGYPSPYRIVMRHQAPGSGCWRPVLGIGRAHQDPGAHYHGGHRRRPVAHPDARPVGHLRIRWKRARSTLAPARIALSPWTWRAAPAGRRVRGRPGLCPAVRRPGADRLLHVDGQWSDVPAADHYLHDFVAMIRGSVKPNVYTRKTGQTWRTFTESPVRWRRRDRAEGAALPPPVRRASRRSSSTRTRG